MFSYVTIVYKKLKGCSSLFLKKKMFRSKIYRRWTLATTWTAVSPACTIAIVLYKCDKIAAFQAATLNRELN